MLHPGPFQVVHMFVLCRSVVNVFLCTCQHFAILDDSDDIEEESEEGESDDSGDEAERDGEEEEEGEEEVNQEEDGKTMCDLC